MEVKWTRAVNTNAWTLMLFKKIQLTPEKRNPFNPNLCITSFCLLVFTHLQQSVFSGGKGILVIMVSKDVLGNGSLMFQHRTYSFSTSYWSLNGGNIFHCYIFIYIYMYVYMSILAVRLCHNIIGTWFCLVAFKRWMLTLVASTHRKCELQNKKVC